MPVPAGSQAVVLHRAVSLAGLTVAESDRLEKTRCLGTYRQRRYDVAVLLYYIAALGVAIPDAMAGLIINRQFINRA